MKNPHGFSPIERRRGEHSRWRGKYRQWHKKSHVTTREKTNGFVWFEEVYMESVSWGQAIHALPRLKSQDEKLLFNAGIAIKIGNRYDSTGLQEDERTPGGSMWLWAKGTWAPNLTPPATHWMTLCLSLNLSVPQLPQQWMDIENPHWMYKSMDMKNTDSRTLATSREGSWDWVLGIDHKGNFAFAEANTTRV